MADADYIKEEYRKLCSDAAELLRASIAPRDVAGKVDDRSHQEPISAETGVTIGRYINVRHFKDGLFSELFKAVLPNDNDLQRSGTLVALKVSISSMMQPPHDAEREARILSTCKCDHIIPLLESFKQPGSRFVMALPFMAHDLDGLLLASRLTDRSRRSITRDLFAGLAYLHDSGIIHRDIKPSNILLDSPEGPAVIADFGIAWSSSDTISEPANEKILDVGTTCYRPPELLFGNMAYGTALDLWAAGCVAAQMVCLNRKTLFDSGDLGSELALIRSIFETLGTPNTHIWPEVATFPDWGKMDFRKYPAQPWERILHGAEPEAIDLVSSLVMYESSRRLRAREVLEHPYLQH